MASEAIPAFLFYVKDWASSRKVQAMSYDERGRYLELLVEQWQTGSLPATPAAIAALFGDSEAGWTRAWPRLSPCFTTRKRDGLLVNSKLEAVRRERLRYQKVQAESGLRGAKARWKRHGKPIGSPSKPIGGSMANDGSDLISSDLISSDLKVHSTVAPAAAGLSRPSKANGTGLRDRFEAFWKLYPKKVGKDAAWRAWQKRQPGQDLTAQIVAALAWQRTQDTWLREGGRFIPNPATWINAGRWQDEPCTTPRLSDRTIATVRAAEEFMKS